MPVQRNYNLKRDQGL